MIELFQAEWCPASQRVRMRLTELDIDFVARQVPVEKSARLRVQQVARTDSIPVLVDGDQVVAGEDAIHAFLDEFAEPPGARDHREKARMAQEKQRKELMQT